jgi:hypothetical protein
MVTIIVGLAVTSMREDNLAERTSHVPVIQEPAEQIARMLIPLPK